MPRGPVWEGIIIDDRTVASKIPRCVRPSESPAIQIGPVAYEAVGLPRKLSKAFRGATNVEVWGARVDGREGTVRAKDDSVQRTVAFTMAVLALGVATVDIWQSVLGLWTHLLLFRRVAFGLLDEVYAFAPPADCAQAIPAAARDELLGLLALAPLLVSDMRAPVSTSVTACDASPWACAGVESTLSEGAVRELWRFRDRKGGYIRCETDARPARRTTMRRAARSRPFSRPMETSCPTSPPTRKNSPGCRNSQMALAGARSSVTVPSGSASTSISRKRARTAPSSSAKLVRRRAMVPDN